MAAKQIGMTRKKRIDTIVSHITRLAAGGFTFNEQDVDANLLLCQGHDEHLQQSARLGGMWSYIKGKVALGEVCDYEYYWIEACADGIRELEEEAQDA